MGWPGICPVTDLVAIYPGCHVRSVDDQGLVKPFEIFSHDTACILPPEKSTRATILWLGGILVLDAIVNLAFVTHHHVAWNTAEEYPGIQICGMGDAFQLQDEVTQHAFSFQLASTVLDVQPPLVTVNLLAISG